MNVCGKFLETVFRRYKANKVLPQVGMKISENVTTAKQTKAAFAVPCLLLVKQRRLKQTFSVLPRL